MARTVHNAFRTFRLGESALLQGTPFFGLILGLPNWAQDGWRAAWVLLGSFLVTHSVFIMNDIADLQHDSRVPHKSPRTERLQRIGKRRLMCMGALSAVAGVTLIARLNSTSAFYAAGVLLAGAVYSLPPFRSKIRPLGSSATHVLGGLSHFMIGYSLGDGPVLHGIAMGLFFAGVFAAGHLVQELRDYEGDMKDGVRTNACRFGRRHAFLASLALFVLAATYAAALAYRGIAPREFMAASLCIPVVLYASVAVFRRSFALPAVLRFQTVYRIAYVLLGGYWLVVLS